MRSNLTNAVYGALDCASPLPLACRTSEEAML
jgi:hypothetical protein